MRPNAFTLLELLTSVTVVIVLTALTLGAVHRVRESGEASRCIGNLRQLATANLAYAADHDGFYVPAQEPENKVRWHGVRGSDKEPFDGTQGPLAPYLGEEHRIKLCPTFKNALTGRDSFETSTGGYGYNAVYIGGVAGDYFRSERLGNVSRAATTVMFTDTAFARAKGIQEYAYAEPYYEVNETGKLASALTPSVHFRHDGRANVAWCDGHVSGEKPSKYGGTNNFYRGDSQKWQIGWFGPETENGWWNPHREEP